jgi:hypothetical protein
MGGLVYGRFIRLGLEVLNDEPEGYLGEPQAGPDVLLAVHNLCGLFI